MWPQALYASKIISYAQGFMLLRQAAKEFSWSLNYGAIALMWRGGCIIRRYASTLVQNSRMSTSIKHAVGFSTNAPRKTKVNVC